MFELELLRLEVPLNDIVLRFRLASWLTRIPLVDCGLTFLVKQCWFAETAVLQDGMLAKNGGRLIEDFRDMIFVQELV